MQKSPIGIFQELLYYIKKQNASLKSQIITKLNKINLKKSKNNN